MKVVIADDSSIMRKNCMSIAKQIGLEVVAECEDGAKALEAIKALKPDVAIVDYIMPYLTGGEIVRYVREHKLPTKVILATSMGQRAAAFDPTNKPDGIIIKPFVTAIMRLEIARAFS